MENLEFSPVENPIGMIQTRTSALRNELEEPRSSEFDQLPRLQSLQRILQGSVAVQVNSGVLSVCTAFLSGEPATRLRVAALLEFMAVCKRAIRVHFPLIGEEDQEFHTQLVNGFQSLTAELSHYIPAILSPFFIDFCSDRQILVLLFVIGPLFRWPVTQIPIQLYFL